MKNRVLIVLGLLLAITGQSCLRNNCKCPDVPDYVRVDKIYITAMQLNSHGTELSPVADSGMLNSADLRMFTDFRFDYYGDCKPVKRQLISFISEATACDCNPPGYKGQTEKITGLEVVSVLEFNQQFGVGDTITGIVKWNNLNTADFVADWNRGLTVNRASITFDQAPETEQWLKLRVILHYGNQVMEAETVHFRLLP